MKLSTLWVLLLQIQAKMTQVFNFIGLREHDLTDVSAKNKRDYNPEAGVSGQEEVLPQTRGMLPEVRATLQ